MAKAQKYLFDMDFGAPPRPVEEVSAEVELLVEEIEEAPPPPPTFTEEELALVRDQAFEQGRQSGLEEASSATERLLAMALAAISEQMRGLEDVQSQANDSLMRDAIAVAMMVVRKLQPEFARSHVLEEIAGVVQQCLSHIEKDVRVTIRVNPAHLDDVRQMAGEVAEATGFEGKLVYAGDPRIAPGDCRVEWGDGGAERDQARLWADIDATIARTLGDTPDNAVSH